MTSFCRFFIEIQANDGQQITSNSSRDSKDYIGRLKYLSVDCLFVVLIDDGRTQDVFRRRLSFIVGCVGLGKRARED